MSTTTALPTTLPTGTWVVDPDHTTIEFRVKHVGLAGVRGVFHRFDGALVVGADGVTSASGTVDAASLDTRVAARDGHLRSADFFDVDNHPQITFSATSIQKWNKAVDGGGLLVGNRVDVRLEVSAARRP